MTEIERLREALADMIDLAEEAMRDANNDGGEYEIDSLLTEARAALAATPPGAEQWMPIESAPTNRRIFAYGWHTSADPIYDEEAMVWKDRMDGQFYYAPQGGKLNWTPTHWMPLHDAPAPPSPAAGEK